MKEYAFFMILDKEMHIFEHKSKLSVLLIWLFLVFFALVRVMIYKLTQIHYQMQAPKGRHRLA